MFKLDSTLPPELAEDVDRYTRLAAREASTLSEEDRQELAQLAQTLDVRLPAPHERRRARETFDVLEAAMDERLKQMPVEKKQRLLEEAKVQLQEFITRSRRPG